jgi:23S rRNA pseudouridine2605 synthase
MGNAGRFLLSRGGCLVKSTVSPPADGPQRIAKVLARAGLCSRRDAERWIAEGRVAVDGAVLTSPAVTVTAENEIQVDGKPLPEPERARLWRFHKPAGLVTTHRDEKGRPTVFGALPAELPRLVSIGRLDLNSEGLLLLTNDGALARRLELPATGWVRRYKVRVHGFVDPARLAALARGTTVDGIAYGPIRAQLERQQGSNAWITLSLQEGKNREVRRVLEHLGYPVTRLIRLAYGPFQLGHLARGAIEEVLKKVLEEQLGKSSHGDPQSGNHGTAKRAPRRSPRPRGNPPPQAGEGRMGATRGAGPSPQPSPRTRGAGPSPQPSPRTRGEGVAAKPRRARGSMGGP